MIAVARPSLGLDSRVRPESTAPGPGPSPELSAPDGNAWARFSAGTAPLKAKIERFASPFTDGSGYTKFRWSKPGDALPLDLSVNVESGDPARVVAQVWTNANNNAEPEKFYAKDMVLQKREGNRLSFHLDLPVDRIGNYRAVGRISTDGGQNWQWMNQSGIGDLIFRARDVKHEAINMREIHIGMANYDLGQNAQRFATVEDLTAGSGYNLEKLAAEGVNTIWLMAPFYTTRWPGSNPEDVAGSPFASRDYFSIDPRLSRAAQEVPENEPERRREVGLESFKRMVDKARSLGIEVVLDIALNHAGHNFIFRDLFETQRGYEVQKNNFSQIAVNHEQLDTIDRMLKDPNVESVKKRYMEYLFPWAYAKWGANGGPDSNGASKLDEMVVGGWGTQDWLKWWDTKQWNHGGNWSRGWVEAGSDQQLKVNDWYGRVLTFWSSVVGVSGFRLDHGQALPNQFWERVLNRVQASADKNRPGMHVFIMPEDHNRNDYTRNLSDVVQTAGWTGDLVYAMQGPNVDHLWWVLNHPYFKQPVGSPSHDEHRISNAFGGDLRAAGRFHAFMQLLGGPYMSLFGDEFGEGQKLLFKEYKGVPTIWMANQGSLPAANWEMDRTIAQAGRAKVSEPALRTAERARLFTRDGHGAGAGGAIAGLARHADGPGGQTVLVFANLNNGERKSDSFKLDEETARRIDPNRRYVVRDLMARDPNRSRPWSQPMPGSELLRDGVWVDLEPYQVMALALEPA